MMACPECGVAFEYSMNFGKTSATQYKNQCSQCKSNIETQTSNKPFEYLQLYIEFAPGIRLSTNSEGFNVFNVEFVQNDLFIFVPIVADEGH